MALLDYDQVILSEICDEGTVTDFTKSWSWCIYTHALINQVPVDFLQLTSCKYLRSVTQQANMNQLETTSIAFVWPQSLTPYQQAAVVCILHTKKGIKRRPGTADIQT